jgi:hypothetical protein
MMAMDAITGLKSLLLDLMGSVFENNGDITATQQMGVQLSNGIKKDGVVIIQNQNFEIYGRIVPKLVEAIRRCDALQNSWDHDSTPEIEPPTPAIEYKPSPSEITDPIQECCRHLYVSGVDWADMQQIMRKRYVLYAVSVCGTQVKAATALKMQTSYLNKLLRSVEKSDDH